MECIVVSVYTASQEYLYMLHTLYILAIYNITLILYVHKQSIETNQHYKIQ